MMESEKYTRKKSNRISLRLSDVDVEEARYVMKELEIPTFSALVRELIDEMYLYLTSEDWKKRSEEGEDDVI